MSGVFPPDIIAGAVASHQAYPACLASLSLAQWADESAWGTKVSGKNNYGGITAKVAGAVFPFNPGTPLEPATLCATEEEYQGKRVACKRWFKDFDSVADFFEQHAQLIATAPIYAPAVAKLPDVTAYVTAIASIYATDQGYAQTLLSIINFHNLTQYDGAST